jgi:hypothetical protein
MTYGEVSEENPRFVTSVEQAPEPQLAFTTIQPDYFEISLMNLLFLY